MTTSDIASRAQARRTAAGWMARCPAHDDRSPSLSICEGRDGRTLLRCFAGCDLAAIVSALGLTLGDLFADASKPPSALRAVRQVGADDVERSLQAELARVVADESRRLGFDVAALVRHRNAARAVVERRYAVRLAREPIPWAEIEPHALDPAWAACVDQAMSVAAAVRGISGSALRSAIEDLPRMQHRVLLYARRLQRTLIEGPVSSRQRAA